MCSTVGGGGGGGVQCRGDIMSTVGVILSTMGDTQYRGDIMSTAGMFNTVGEYHPL